MVSGSRAYLTFILSDHPHRPSRHVDGALAGVGGQRRGEGWSLRRAQLIGLVDANQDSTLAAITPRGYPAWPPVAALAKVSGNAKVPSDLG
jgi:hypothetical protein